MAFSMRLIPETVKTLSFGSIGASYMGIGTSFSSPVRVLIFQNLTDAALMLSFDGVNDHMPLPTNGYIVLDITANKNLNEGFYIAEGARVYAKELSATPTTGSVYVSAFGGGS